MRFTEDGKRDYSMKEILTGNLLIAVWILLGTAAFWLFNTYAAVAFFVVSAVLVFYGLGKKGCLSCYYCKTCSIGIGKLPDLFFSNEGIKNLNKKGRALWPFTYGLVAFLPVAIAGTAVAFKFSTVSVALFGGLLMFAVSSIAAMQKRNLRTKNSALPC